MPNTVNELGFHPDKIRWVLEQTLPSLDKGLNFHDDTDALENSSGNLRSAARYAGSESWKKPRAGAYLTLEI